MSTKLKLMLLAVAMAVLCPVGSIRAATMSFSASSPTVNGEDIASYGTSTGSDKWWPGGANDYGNPGKTVGQTFTTGATGAIFNAVTFRISSATAPTKEYTIRVGTVSGTTFTEIYSETATQSASTAANNYWTWTLDSPVVLSANTVYGVDVGLNSSTSEWTTGIPYVYYTADVYADGTRFRSGTAGYGIGDTTMTQVSGDRVFHLDMDVTPEADLITALTELKDHIEGTITLSAAEIAAHKATIDSDSQYMGNNATVIAASFDMVAAYDSEIGPLFVSGSPIQSFTRSSAVDDIHWTTYWVMQYIMDYTYTAANIASHEALLDGFKFGTSAYFPGAADPPENPDATYTVSIDGSYLDMWGHEIMHEDRPAVKPTGAYLAPGSIATITVPSSIAGKGYTVRVCAHSWDFSNKPTVKRLDRSSLVYSINSTQTKVASPLGGGIYIQVPEGQNAGVVSVQIKNAIRSPYFSAKSFHTTTLSQWQNTERNHLAPWADFQSEKYIMQVPTDWIYNYDDPVTLMDDWDTSMDIMDALMGYPDRTRESMYQQVDLYFRSSVYAPGYPTVNVTYNPNTSYGGDYNHWMLTGPQYAHNTVFHEEGHGYLFQKFAGETESAVNLLHVAVYDHFYDDLDYALRTSRGYSNTYMTLDTTAIEWMTVFNFSFYKAPMASGEKAYQLKGHAKFVDIARLFGWEVLNDFWYSFNEDYENSDPIDTSNDGLMLRLAKCVGVDVTPLLHFWGIHPVNASALADAIAAENLQASHEIYDTLVHYKSIVPADNAAFQAYALAWWQHVPSINGNWTEREHTRQWDTTNYWVPNGWDYCGTDPAQADGEIYTGATCARIKAVIDELIELYFPPDTINEMENGVMSGAVIASNHAGYTGTGFADYTVSTGAYVQLTVNVPTGGNYDLSYRYALASGNRPLEIKVNGQVVAASLSFPATGAWTTWGYTATVPVTLNAGNNTVRATTIGSNGANVDHLLVEWY